MLSQQHGEAEGSSNREMPVELYSSLTDLTKWAERRREAIADSREAYDREHGRPAETTLTTEHRP
ncbi:hypothetical protein ACWGDS_39445 [Streptomyces sp. NPDC055059]|uniref:hypothetical protein n=1 Tax=Streptomyces sp. NPDC127172 TaxID=3345382 RepID=UPI00362F53E3